ncbi:GIY-YIG nuclease family protein [Gordonia westfalica]|uniref:GIY-YIG nuclease family protein n=1 Tax=Gordonia westfalica TaxID=158898 RepID=A0ABU2GYV6_9ACTN|nr:GIY-YIG nuclease family protein [Gordonia westfalica]MDS1116651.1 GIY-YIG nuclease family protein [Gordonia westfalica]
MADLPNSLIESWTPDPRVATWADKRGFGPAQDMSNSALVKLAKAYKGKPVGLYIWESANHEVYVGISNDSVTKRLRQHVKNYDTANI